MDDIKLQILVQSCKLTVKQSQSKVFGEASFIPSIINSSDKKFRVMYLVVHSRCL